MSDRRCYSRTIVESARFLKLPVKSQILYFYLLLHADMDGIVEAYTVMKMINANENDLGELVGKNLIVILNDDLVSFIVDWLEHNTSSFLRRDRNSDSIYRELLLKVYPEAKVIQRVPRSDTSNRNRKISGQDADSPRTAQVKLKEEKLNKVNERKACNKNGFINFHQREYDYSQLEKMLLTSHVNEGDKRNVCK